MSCCRPDTNTAAEPEESTVFEIGAKSQWFDNRVQVNISGFYHEPMALRDRVEDIPDFIDFFSQRFATKYNRPRWQPTPEELREFCEFRWPGNIRQLGHVIEQSYVLDCTPSLPESRNRDRGTPALPYVDLERLRKVAVMQAMKSTRGHKGRAAKLLGVHPNTLTRLLAQIGYYDQGDQGDNALN